MEMLMYVAGGLFIFVLGTIVGANNVPSVQKAIAALKSAEQNAQDTLAKITAHKAS